MGPRLGQGVTVYYVHSSCWPSSGFIFIIFSVPFLFSFLIFKYKKNIASRKANRMQKFAFEFGFAFLRDVKSLRKPSVFILGMTRISMCAAYSTELQTPQVACPGRQALLCATQAHIRAAEEDGDFSPKDHLQKVLKNLNIEAVYDPPSRSYNPLHFVTTIFLILWSAVEYKCWVQKRKPSE